jgi:hypothetical protein
MSAVRSLSCPSSYVVVEQRVALEISSASAPRSSQNCLNFLSDDE